MKKWIRIVVIIVAVIAGLIFGIVKYKESKNTQIMQSEEKQVEVLKEIYTDMLQSVDKSTINIKLDESCLKNLVTDEEFSQKNKEVLKGLENTVENATNTYILYLSKSSDKNTLKLKIEDDLETFSSNQEYTLYVENENIEYETNGLGNISYQY